MYSIIYILLAYKHKGVKAYKHGIYFAISPKKLIARFLL